MKNCKWFVFLLFLLLYAFIVFRYVQKKPTPSETMTPVPATQEIKTEEMNLTHT